MLERIIRLAAFALALAAVAFPQAARAEDGVFAHRIVFGQAALLNGPAAALGRGMRMGILTAFAEANRAGGVNGRRLELAAAAASERALAPRREACMVAAGWLHGLTVAVDVSPVQIHQGDLPRRVKEAPAASGVAPEWLELEVTESAMIRDAARAREMLEQVRALGMRVALDDFGTGYSSLGTLRSFPFDRIKIDRRFVGHLPAADATMVMRAVLAPGQGLNIPVLVEGVEMAARLEMLRQMGHREVQGYLIGRPMPVERCRALVGGPGRVAGIGKLGELPLS
ncbi:MAG: EAL domain-containing protein [Rhodospirillales bacterium]|nr:EAL domain-containing protein [Rhodospirillales bacterium]